MYVVPFIYRIYISYVSYQSVPLGCLRIFSCDDAEKCWSSAAGYALDGVQKKLAGSTYLLCHIHAVKGVAEVAAGQLGGGAMMQTLLLAAHATEQRKREGERKRGRETDDYLCQTVLSPHSLDHLTVAAAAALAAQRLLGPHAKHILQR